MPFPASGGTAVKRAPLPKKGKSRSRRYAVSWAYREEPTNDDNALYVNEVKSTNIQSAVTALLRSMNDGEEEKLRKSDIVVVEVRIMARGEQLVEHDDEGDEEE